MFRMNKKERRTVRMTRPGKSARAFMIILLFVTYAVVDRSRRLSPAGTTTLNSVGATTEVVRESVIVSFESVRVPSTAWCSNPKDMVTLITWSKQGLRMYTDTRESSPWIHSSWIQQTRFRGSLWLGLTPESIRFDYKHGAYYWDQSIFISTHSREWAFPSTVPETNKHNSADVLGVQRMYRSPQKVLNLMEHGNLS